MEHIINVTKNDIRIAFHHIHIKKDKEHCCHCPIARACKRVLKSAFLKVMAHDIIATRNKCYPLPKKAQRFITHFDKGLPVHPFTFKIKPLINRGF